MTETFVYHTLFRLYIHYMSMWGYIKAKGIISSQWITPYLLEMTKRRKNVNAKQKAESNNKLKSV